MSKIERIVNIARDPRWWGFYLQRRVRSPAHRLAIAQYLAGRRPNFVPSDPNLAKAGAARLNDLGLCPMGQLLSAKKSRELVKYFEEREAFDPYRSSAQKFLPKSNNRPPDTHIAHHDPVDILKAPHLLELCNDPRVLSVVSRFLGCKPTIGYMATWWSYPTAVGPQQAENFHRDVDDWRFVKLFVYLTDVEIANGPHKYVLQSSTQSKLTAIRRFDDQEVVGAFGSDRIQTMTSKAGEGFLEDTYGIHKGQPVQSGHRLLFQVVYTLSPLPYAPRRPVSHMPVGAPYDPWINRVYLK